MKNKAKVITAVVVIILLAVLCVIMVSGVLHVVQNADIESSEPDPMFETPVEQVTRPPELDAEEVQPEHDTLDSYIDEAQSPVDLTAEELAEEAAGSAASNK